MKFIYVSCIWTKTVFKFLNYRLKCDWRITNVIGELVDHGNVSILKPLIISTNINCSLATY